MTEDEEALACFLTEILSAADSAEEIMAVGIAAELFCAIAKYNTDENLREEIERP